MNSQLPMQRVAITWVNHCGAALVKVVPFSTFDSAVQIGVGFSPVADAFCADGSVDASHSLARPDDDLRLRADPKGLAWLEPSTGWAWAPGQRWQRSGEPYAADQRNFCAQQQQLLHSANITLMAGFELEWLVAGRSEDGSFLPAVLGGPYGADRLIEGLDYATAILNAFDAAGLPWLQFHPEYGSGQFEFSFSHTTAVEAADRLVHAKLLIQRVSNRFGLRCSFSPKPLLGQVGNGGHLHLSLQQADTHWLQGGAGIGELQPQGEAFIAALLNHLPALLALACPLAVSYLRLAPSSWSAPFQVWGVENREAALRLIPTAADGVSAHLELKVADLAANPYLFLGAVQAVAWQAIQQPAKPLPAAVVGDPALLPDGLAKRLPINLTEASAAFAASELLQKSMGLLLHSSLVDSQKAEIKRCAHLCDEQLVVSSRWWPVVGAI